MPRDEGKKSVVRTRIAGTRIIRAPRGRPHQVKEISTHDRVDLERSVYGLAGPCSISLHAGFDKALSRPDLSTADTAKQ